MSDYNDRPTSVNVTRGSGGGLYFIVGALLVLVLVGGYVMMGTPGLNTSAGGLLKVDQGQIDEPALWRHEALHLLAESAMREPGRVQL